MYSLEELERKCKLLRLKRKIFPLFVLTILLVGGYIGYTYYIKSSNKNALKKEIPTIEKPNETKKAQRPIKEGTNPKCFSLQMYYGYGSYHTRLQKFQKNLESKGFHCFIVQKSMSSHNALMLRCNESTSKKALKPWLEYARSLGIDAYIVNSDCRHKIDRLLQLPKRSKKSKVAVENEKKKIKKEDSLLKSKPTTIEELRQTYQQRPNYRLALQIARNYYEMGRYDQAIEWAKKANRLDRMKDEAWILYAKSLYKKGNKDKAIRLLEFFLKFKDSSKARKLLREWR